MNMTCYYLKNSFYFSVAVQAASNAKRYSIICELNIFEFSTGGQMLSSISLYLEPIL